VRGHKTNSVILDEWLDFHDAIMSVRVAPAAMKGEHVEQPSKEVRAQVQQEDPRESKDR
jgi:hypothetical protein